MMYGAPGKLLNILFKIRTAKLNIGQKVSPDIQHFYFT